jgi:ADP-ribose pyrophosphatase
MKAALNRTLTLYRGRVFELVRENITLPNGVTFDLEVIHHPGAAAVVPVMEDRTILLIRQYRHAAGGFIWEIPAGTLNPGEPPLECAKRELVEETGFSAGKFRKLGEITPVPGYSTERIHLFLATDLRPATQKLDKDELLDVHRVGIESAFERVMNGEIQDGKTICALFLAKNLLQAR